VMKDRVKRFVKPLYLALRGRRRMGQALNEMRYMLSARGERIGYAPVELALSITDRCTYECDMCLTHSTKVPANEFRHRPAPDMPWEMFCDVIERFKNARILWIIGSGEPMLHADFFRMVEMGARLKMDVHATSNGTTVEENIDRILASGLASLNVSINGDTPDEFHRMSGMRRESYAATLKAVRRLTAAKRARGGGPKIGVSFILDRQNYLRAQAMVDLAASLGAELCSLNNILPSDAPGFRAEERCLFDDDEEAMRSLARVHTVGRMAVSFPRFFPREARYHCCETFFRQIRVDGNGDVGGCSIALLRLDGNGKYDAPDAWNNEYFRRMRRMFLDGARLPVPCRTCQMNVPYSLGWLERYRKH